MERKVIALAGKTLVVSLPMEWVKKNGIKKGDSLPFELGVSKIEIYAHGRADKPSKEVTLRLPLEGAAYRILGALYKAGYDEVEVKSDIKSNLEEIEEVGRREFVGFEITKKDSGRLGLKMVSRIDSDSFDKMLRRAFLLTLEIAEGSKKSVTDLDNKEIERLILLDKEVNKYTDFCRRILNTTGYTKTEQASPLYYIIEELEKISDAFRDILVISKESSGTRAKALDEIHAAAVSEIRSFYELYYGFSIESLKKLLTEHESQKKRLREFMLKSKGVDTLLASQMQLIDSLIWNTNGAIMILKL